MPLRLVMCIYHGEAKSFSGRGLYTDNGTFDPHTGAQRHPEMGVSRPVEIP